MLVADYLAHAFAYDGRFWRTLIPLLSKPGWLTEQNLKERWVSFLPPMRMYLVISLLFFAALTAVLPERAGRQFQVAGDEGNVTTDLNEENISPPPEGNVVTDYINERVHAKTEKLKEMDPEVRDFVLYRGMISAIPTTLLLAVPLFALGLKVFYFLRRRYFFDHFVFATHFYCAWLIVLGPSLVVNEAWLWIAGHGIYLPIYLFLALKRVYQQHWALTFIKVVMLGFWQVLSFTLLMLTVVLTAFFSA